MLFGGYRNHREFQVFFVLLINKFDREMFREKKFRQVVEEMFSTLVLSALILFCHLRLRSQTFQGCFHKVFSFIRVKNFKVKSFPKNLEMTNNVLSFTIGNYELCFRA
jgi:hypothetical protein